MSQELPFGEFQKLAEENGYKVRDCKYGHWQILFGPLLVNFYPKSEKQTLYCPEPYLEAELCDHDESKLFELLQKLKERSVKQCDIFERGRLAFLAGHGFGDSPFPPGWEKDLWEDGWYAGKTETFREN